MTVGELLELLKDADRDAVIVCSDNCGGDYIPADVCFLDGFVELGFIRFHIAIAKKKIIIF